MNKDAFTVYTPHWRSRSNGLWTGIPSIGGHGCGRPRIAAAMTLKKPTNGCLSEQFDYLFVGRAQSDQLTDAFNYDQASVLALHILHYRYNLVGIEEIVTHRVLNLDKLIHIIIIFGFALQR